MRFRRSSLLVATCLAAPVSLFSGPALAQTDTASARPVADGADHSAGGDIVVTARRREERLQDVPVSVTALTAADLDRQVVQQFTDLQQTSPGLQTGANTTTGGRKAISLALRGVRSSAVALYSAEIVRNPLTVFDMMYDLESVQVLKGPQGTLFGSNSTAGAILVSPAKPKDFLEGYAEARVGNYGAYGGTGMVNVPLGSIAALRVAGDFEKRNGFIKGPVRDYDADDHRSVRVSLKVEPVSGLTNTTVYEHYYYSAQAQPIVPVGYAPCPTAGASSAPCVYSAAATAPLGLPSYVAAVTAELANGVFHTNLTASYPQSIKSNVVSNITQMKVGAPFGDIVGDLTFKMILGYADFRMKQRDDSDGLVLDVVDVTRDTAETRHSEEFQVQGEGWDKRLNWVVGMYVGDTVTRLTSYPNIQLSPFNANNPIYQNNYTKDSQLAVYSQATIEVLPKFRLTAGYRQTWTKTSVTSQAYARYGAATQACTLPVGAPGVNSAACTRYQSTTDQQPSWTLGADFKYSANGLLYFVTRRGFNSGGFNGSALSEGTSSYAPETLTDYELGVKQSGEIGGVNVRANLAIFRNDYSGLQRRNILLVPFGTGVVASPLIINVAKARIEGVEGELDVSPSRALSLHAGFSYLDARYLKFPYSLTATTSVDLSGNALGQAPEWAFVVGGNYAFPQIPGFATVSVSANYSYQTRIAFLDVNAVNASLPNTADPNNIQEGYGVLNGQISFANLLGTKLTLEVWAKNLTNTLYFGQKSGALGFASGTPGEPRTFGAKLSYHF